MTKYLQKFATNFMTTISLMTAVGVFMHDGRIDRATWVALKSPQAHLKTSGNLVARLKAFADTDAHTHPDHNTGRSLINSFTYKSPSIAPRRMEKKADIEAEIEGGRHAFDNVNLPILL